MKVQFEIQDWVVSQLEELKNITGSDDYKELFNNAVALLAWAVEQQAAGNAVASIDPEAKEFRRLKMPARHLSQAGILKIGMQPETGAAVCLGSLIASDSCPGSASSPAR